jgi:hypothetical protein
VRNGSAGCTDDVGAAVEDTAAAATAAAAVFFVVGFGRAITGSAIGCARCLVEEQRGFEREGEKKVVQEVGNQKSNSRKGEMKMNKETFERQNNNSN